MRCDGVILDMDGTLLDSLAAWVTAGEAYLQSRGIVPRGDPQDSLMAQDMPSLARHFQRSYGIDEPVDAIVQGFKEQVRRSYAADAVAKDGAEAFLRHLRDAGVRVCVATATDRELACPVLEKCGLMPYIEQVFTAAEIAPKSEPTMFLAAAQWMHTPVATTWVFEDSSYAIRTARAAGFPVCGVQDRFQRNPERVKALADLYIQSFEQIRRNAAGMLEFCGGS